LKECKFLQTCKAGSKSPAFFRENKRHFSKTRAAAPAAAISRALSLRSMAVATQHALLLDASLRGAAVALALLTAWRLLRWHRHASAARFGAAFSLVMALYIAFASAALNPLMQPAALPLIVAINQGSALLWLFSQSLFDDGFRWRWRFALPSAALLVLTLAGFAVPSQWRIGALLAFHAAAIALLAATLFKAVRSRENDLVDERRRFAVALSLLIPVTGLVTSVVEIAGIANGVHWALNALQTATMLALSFLFADWIASHGAAIFGEQRQPRAVAAEIPASFSPADRIELARLRELVGGGALFDHGAGVAQLARLAAIPEHRLRRLVNRGMGYRNFRELVNDVRIAEARNRLADPARAREQVLNLSWDLGYDSLAPFNRAFRERTGMSPTDYRKSALAKTVAQG
jgi:AraC-like DNA-binding protein